MPLPFYTGILGAADSLFAGFCDGSPGVLLNHMWNAHDKPFGFLCYIDNAAAGFCVGRYNAKYTVPTPVGLLPDSFFEVLVQQDAKTFSVNGVSTPYNMDEKPADLHEATGGFMSYARTRAHVWITTHATQRHTTRTQEAKKPCLTRTFGLSWDFDKDFSGVFRCPVGMFQVGTKIEKFMDHEGWSMGKNSRFSFECKTPACFE